MIREQILKDLEKVLEKLEISSANLSLEHPAEASFGDYSTNITLRTKHKDFANPMDFANKIVATWRTLGLPEYLAKIEVVLPGFINLWLKEEFLVSQVSGVLKEKGRFGKQDIGRGKTVVIDYSAPNIAKSFGIGHLRSTNIGQAIYNLYSTLGYKVIGDNHLGDWGTQFGKLIYQIELIIHNSEFKIKDLTIEKLEKLYVDFHRQVEKNPEMEDEARLWFKKLEEGDPEAKRVWQKCVEISLKEFERVYELLGVKIDHAYGESFYQDKVQDVVQEAKRMGLAKESEGALVMTLPGFDVPLMLLKKDEGTTYHTRDLATIKFRMEKWQPDLIVYEVGADQKFHFQHLFAAVVLFGWAKKTRFVHVAHGLIRFPEGKMSTRKGQTIHLEDVLNEAIKKAEKIIKSSATDRGLGVRAKQEVAKAVGIGAVKYSDLKQNPQTDIIFDWERIFNLEGDSGPYLQYTYARCQSVLRKAEVGSGKLDKNNLTSNFKNPASHLSPLTSEETSLLRTIYKFPEIIESAAVSFSPNLLCAFLFDLAQKYNFLYNKLPILKGEEGEREFRLALTAATGQVLKNGLGLLGIETPAKM